MKTNNIYIPISIILAGGIVAGAIVFLGTNNNTTAAGNFGNNNSNAAEHVRLVDETDHRKGNGDAKVTIIEYSDFECPFCAQFHPTLSRIIDNFGGEVAWVYRHFPLTNIHSRATAAAVASECVAELGGNDAFWIFADEMFLNQRTLGPALYKRVAQDLGVEESAFDACVESGRYEERVQMDFENAISSGGRGTPFSVVINEKGEAFPFAGALPYETVRTVIEQALEG